MARPFYEARIREVEARCDARRADVEREPGDRRAEERLGKAMNALRRYNRPLSDEILDAREACLRAEDAYQRARGTRNEAARLAERNAARLAVAQLQDAAIERGEITGVITLPSGRKVLD